MALGSVVGRAVVELAGDNTQLKAAMAEARGQLSTLGATSTTTASRLTSLQRRVGNLAHGLERFGVTALSVGRTMSTYVTLPLVGLGYVATKFSLDFNKALTQVRTLGGDFFKQLGMNLHDVRDEIIKLSGRTAQAPTDLANALYIVSSAGLSASQVMPVLRAAAEGAAVGMGDVSTVGSTLTTILNDYHKSGMSAAQAMDILSEAIRQGKAEPADYAVNLGTVIPQAAQAGISFQDVAAAIATATNAGVSAARSITGLRYLIMSLTNPTAKATEAMKSFGFTPAQIAADLQKPQGLLNVLQALADKMDLTTVKGRAAWAAVLGGVRGTVVAVPQVEGNLQKIQQLWDAVGASAEKGSTSFEKAWNRLQQSKQFNFAKALNDLRIAAINLGKVLLPILNQTIIPTIESVVKAFADLPRSSQRFIVWSGIIAAATGPVLMLVGGLGRLAAILVRIGKLALLDLPAWLMRLIGGGGAAAAGGAAAGAAGAEAAAAGAAGAAATVEVAAGEAATGAAAAVNLPLAPFLAAGGLLGVLFFGTPSAQDQINAQADRLVARIRAHAMTAADLAATAKRDLALAGRVQAAAAGQPLPPVPAAPGAPPLPAAPPRGAPVTGPHVGVAAVFGRRAAADQQAIDRWIASMYNLQKAFGGNISSGEQFVQVMFSAGDITNKEAKFIAGLYGQFGSLGYQVGQNTQQLVKNLLAQGDAEAAARLLNKELRFQIKHLGVSSDAWKKYHSGVAGARREIAKTERDLLAINATFKDLASVQERQNERTDDSTQKQKGMAAAFSATADATNRARDGAKRATDTAGQGAETAKGKVDGLKDSIDKIPRTKSVTITAIPRGWESLIRFLGFLTGGIHVPVIPGGPVHAGPRFRPGRRGGIDTGQLGLGGIIIAGQRGFITQGPVFQFGEGGYSTFAGRGSEAVLPLDQEHGLKVLSEAIRRAMPKTGVEGMVVQLDGYAVGKVLRRRATRGAF